MDEKLPQIELVDVQTEELYEILDESYGSDENIYVLYDDNDENEEVEINELSEDQDERGTFHLYILQFTKYF